MKQEDVKLVSLQANRSRLATQDVPVRALDHWQARLESALQRAKADADEWSQRACEQIGQYETKLAGVGHGIKPHA